MAILGDLLVQGRSRFLQQIYAPGISIDGDTTVTGTLTLSKIQDAAGTANNSPALIVGGPVTSSHLEFDSNEIMAKATGTTTADLYINTDGGIIFLGKSGVKTQVQGNLQVQGTSTFTGAGTYSGNLTVNGTTSLKGTSITGDLTVSNNAKINGSLIVENEIRTPKWIVDNIANLGGEFIIAPTIIGGDNVSVNISAVSNGKYTITVTDSSITSSSFGGIAWSNSSIVKVSGTINDVVLVSVNGTMTQALNTTTNTIQFTVNSSDVTLTAGTYTGNKVKNLHIMMYKNAGIVPVGIFMTSYGESKYPYIDIYSGSSSGSFYSPTTRLGYLTGIKDENGNALTVNGVSPTGWGLYTNNGYFSGTIVSTSGKIGGFTIGTTDIHNGKTSRTETTNNGVWVGTDGIGFGKGITYFSTDGTGKIGPWTLSTTYLRNGSITGATNTSVAGVYLGTDGLNISNGTAATTTYITKTTVNVGNKLTWNGTTLTVTGTVNATAGYFGSSSSNGWQIDSNAIKHGILGSSGGYILNASGNSTATINGASRSNLVLAIGSKFGVSNDGTLYTNGANITNINAENISSGTISVGVLPESVKNENIEIGGRNLFAMAGSIAGYLGTNGTDISSQSASKERTTDYISVDVSTKYALQAWYDQSNPTSSYIWICLSWYASDKTHISQPIREHMTADNYKSWVITSPSNAAYARLSARWVEPGWVYGKVKFERGTKPTDWTPAPEDIDVHEYITDIDSNNGITIKPINTVGNDYLQINSSAISFYRNNVETLKLEDSTLRVGKLGTNLRNIYITDSEVQIRNNTTVIAKFGSTLTFYEPGTTTVAAEVDSNGINVKVGTFGNATNKITVGTGTSGHSAIRYGMTTLADTTNTGFYIGTDGIALGKGVFKVTAAGALTAKSGSIGKYTITDTYLITGTGTSATGIGGNQAFWAGNNDSNSAPFRVSYAGALVSTSATITGTVNATAGYFGSNSTDGWFISSNAITHGTLGSSGGYILNAAGNSSATINGSSRSNLALAIGSKFAVGNDGTLYANGANIISINADNINAGVLNIGNLPESVKNENIEIGGRNLFVDTNRYCEAVSASSTFGGESLPDIVIPEGRVITVSVEIDADNVVWSTASGQHRIGVEFSIAKTGGGYQYIGVWAGNAISEGANVVEAFTGSLHKRIFKTFTLLGDITVGRDALLYTQGVSSGSIRIGRVKVEYGTKATDWTPAPEDVDTNITNAAKTAANYIYADSTGIRIASASPSTQNQRLELTSSTLKMYDASNYQRLKLDSTNGVIIGKESYGHTQVTDTGLFIYDVNNKKRAQVDNNGLSVYLSDGTTSIANFGEVTRIGKAYVSGATDNESHMELDYHSLQLIDKNNQAFFYVSDLRGADGSADIVDVFYGDGSTKRYDLSFIATSNDYTITLSNGNNPNLMNKFNNYFTFNNAPESGVVITVAYKTTNSSAKAFTFGKRESNQSIGAYSFVNGYNAVASGTYSAVLNGYDNTSSGKSTISFGKNSTASGDFSIAGGKQGAVASGEGSIAFGYNATASGSSSIAIGTSANATGTQSCAIGGTQNTASGIYSHAEGSQTTAQGQSSHSEGALCRAQGAYSHAQGYNTRSSGSCSEAAGSDTIAAGAYQTVIGKFNESDAFGSNGLYAFIVGNGTADNARSNALAVNWDGTIESGIAKKGAIQWVNVLNGNAALYVPKDPNGMTSAVGAVTMETSGGGAWTMANYTDEAIRLVYITPENRSAGVNTTTMPIKIDADGRVTTSRDINTTSTSGVFTNGSGITVAVFKFCQRGNVASFYIGASKNTATAANTVITVGTIAEGRRPPFECAGPGTSGVGDVYINENGVVSFRSTSQIAANARFYARVTYPVV